MSHFSFVDDVETAENKEAKFLSIQELTFP